MKATVRRRWKRDELLIMRRLGGDRIPVTGRRTSHKGYQPDGDHPWLAPSIKSRETALVTIQNMMAQAVKAAEWIKRREGKDKLPLGVYHVVGTHYDNALVFMRLKDWEAWFGGGYEIEIRNTGTDAGYAIPPEIEDSVLRMRLS